MLVSLLTGPKEPITLQVTPRVFATHPYQKVTFHLRVWITEHPDNRVVAIAGDCGSDSFSSSYPTDGEYYDYYRSLIPAEECTFVATLFRVTNDKVVSFKAVVSAGDNEWPLTSSSAPTRYAADAGARLTAVTLPLVRTSAYARFLPKPTSERDTSSSSFVPSVATSFTSGSSGRSSTSSSNCLRSG